MKNMYLRLLILPMIILSLVSVTAQEETRATIERCINLGNMLEAPREGLWGLSVQEDYLRIIADAGFDTVRIPIRWSSHAEETAPYTIDPEFMERIYEVVGWALDADLNAIINVHHYEEMMSDPYGEYERLDALWAQIAEAFADYPDTVLFEVLNEPNASLDYTVWNEMYPLLINTIRASNPERHIIIGGDNWNSAPSVQNLTLPDNTDNLIVTFHFYEPFQFTHQGASWVTGSNQWRGTTFGSDADYELISDMFDDVLEWSEEHEVPIFLGEFGAYEHADFESRLLYTEAVREEAEARGFSWCYWEFASGFGIYNAITDQFNDLYPMLIPTD